jgi:predicted nucleotidyltransferase
MDKNQAIKLSKDYLNKVRESDIRFTEAWLFGSYARNNQNENSDIDIAIILSDDESISFETDVLLMSIRKDEETIIEPHTFALKDFNSRLPIVHQIKKDGFRIDI